MYGCSTLCGKLARQLPRWTVPRKRASCCYEISTNYVYGDVNNTKHWKRLLLDLSLDFWLSFVNMALLSLRISKVFEFSNFEIWTLVFFAIYCVWIFNFKFLNSRFKIKWWCACFILIVWKIAFPENFDFNLNICGLRRIISITKWLLECFAKTKRRGWWNFFE